MGARHRSPRPLRAAVAVLSLVLALAACGGNGGDESATEGGGNGGGGSGDGTTVVLRNIKFEPAKISIARGQTVTWRWEDGAVQHDVAGEGFKSEVKASGTFAHTFNESGSFDYICTVHPATMKGTVQVS